MNAWPVTCAPQPDELLSSWMVRLAHAHGLGCERFVTLVFGRQFPIWNRDIDRSASDATLKRLSEISAVTELRLREATLRDIEWRVGPAATTTGMNTGLLPLGVYHRTRRRCGLMFCPVCLASDETPYLRRVWRVKYLACCTLHQVVLRDRCTCGAGVAPHRVDTRWSQHANSGSTLHTRCWSCGKSLERVRAAAAKPALVWLSQLVQDALANRFIALGSDELFAPAFIQGVRVLSEVQAILGGRRGRAPRLLPVEVRAAELTAVGEWLSDWPGAFLADMRALDLTYTDLRRGRTPLPYWIDSVCRASLMIKPAKRSEPEIAAMYQYLHETCRRSSRAQAKEVLGHYVEQRRIPSRWRGDVPTECYELLLAHIDQDIGAVFDPRRRAIAFADKVWLALGCVTRMPLERIARLTVGELRQLAGGRCRKIARAPRTPEEVRFWLRCYLNEARPLIAPMGEDQRAFVAQNGKANLTSNGLSMRFRAHLRRSGLDRQVPSFTGLVKSVAESARTT